MTYDGTLHHRNALSTCRFSPQSSHRWSWGCILHYLVLYTHRYHHTPKENVGIRKCTHTQSNTKHHFACHSINQWLCIKISVANGPFFFKCLNFALQHMTCTLWCWGIALSLHFAPYTCIREHCISPNTPVTYLLVCLCIGHTNTLQWFASESKRTCLTAEPWSHVHTPHTREAGVELALQKTQKCMAMSCNQTRLVLQYMRQLRLG